MKASHNTVKATPKSEKARKSLKVAGAAVLGGLAFKAFEGHDKYTTTNVKDRVAALSQVDYVQAGLFEIKAGAQLRYTPSIENGSPKNGEPNNQDIKVKPGHLLQVSNPLISSEHPGWISFVYTSHPEPGMVFESEADRAKHTVWANFEELEREGLATQTSDPALAGQGKAVTELPAGVDELGAIFVSDPNYVIPHSSIAIGVDQENAGSNG